MSKAASSTWPPQAARVRGDSKESAGMFTWAPLSNSKRATSTWPSWDSETHKECRDKHSNLKVLANIYTLYLHQCFYMIDKKTDTAASMIVLDQMLTMQASISAVCISSVLCSWSAPASKRKRTMSKWPVHNKDSFSVLYSCRKNAILLTACTF